MKIVDFSESYNTLWQDFLLTADLSSFWHSRNYINFLLEINNNRFIRELSFLIFNNNTLIAVCPLFLDCRGGINQFGVGIEPIPYPAILSNSHKKQKNKVFALFMDEVRKKAELYNVSFLYMRIASPVSRSFKYFESFCNPLVINNFYDETYITQIIDLTISEGALWKDVRKGHRSDIKNAEISCVVNIYDRNSINDKAFERYKKLHIKDSGGQTRSNYSYEIMLDWIKTGQAILLEAVHRGESVAIILISLFGAGAYYGSSCVDHDVNDFNASHLLQWAAILWLKRNGYQYYEMGRQFYGQQWDYIPSSKDINISKYKRGFGGTGYSVYCGRFIFDKEYLINAFKLKLNNVINNTFFDYKKSY